MTVEEPQCSATHPFMIQSFSLLSHSLSTLRTHRRRPCTVRWGSSVRTGRRLWAAPPSPCGSAWPVRPPCRWCSRCSPGDRCAGAPLAGLKKGGGDGGGERMGGREDEEQQLIKRTVDMNISINRSRQFSRCSAKLRWTDPVRKYSTVSADAAVFFFVFFYDLKPRLVGSGRGRAAVFASPDYLARCGELCWKREQWSRSTASAPIQF